MGNPNQQIDESPVAGDPTAVTAGSASPDVDAAVQKALAEFAAQHGLPAPAPPAAKPSALLALKELSEDAAQTTFGHKVLALADAGIQEAELVAETPAVRAIAAIVGELASKIA
jgi:hypothetical protein